MHFLAPSNRGPFVDLSSSIVFLKTAVDQVARKIASPKSPSFSSLSSSTSSKNKARKPSPLILINGKAPEKTTATKKVSKKNSTTTQTSEKRRKSLNSITDKSPESKKSKIKKLVKPNVRQSKKIVHDKSSKIRKLS